MTQSLIFLVVILLGAIVLFALYRRRSVKFSMKAFGATLFLEATDEPGPPHGVASGSPTRGEFEQVSAANRPDPKLIESTESK
jgi:hypothetical protein